VDLKGGVDLSIVPGTGFLRPKRHRFSKVRGAPWGFPLFTLNLPRSTSPPQLFLCMQRPSRRRLVCLGDCIVIIPEAEKVPSGP